MVATQPILPSILRHVLFNLISGGSTHFFEGVVSHEDFILTGNPQLHLALILLGLDVVLALVIHVLRSDFTSTGFGGIVVEYTFMHIMVIELHPH